MIYMKTIWFVDKDTAPIEEYFTQQRAVKQAQYFQAKGFNVKVKEATQKS